MKNSLKKQIISTFMSIPLITVSLCGCGYTDEEKQTMAEYEKQGEINAVNYIKEKYGFESTVVDVTCKKYSGGMDFSPSPTGNVYVTFEQEDKSFLVEIPGDEVTSIGFDNYQFEEIKSALAQKLYDLTELPLEELFLCCGNFKDTGVMESGKNGLITTYFDGENLAEVLTDTSAALVVSYINQDISLIDADMLKEQTGIEDCLFVDYADSEQYATIKNPYYNIAGSPIDWTIEHNVLYINDYRLIDSNKDTYTNCGKRVINDIVFITENTDEQVAIQKITLNDASNWNGRGFINAEQVLDAYVLETDSSKVNVYIPVDILQTTDIEHVTIVEQYKKEGKTSYSTAVTRLTDDKKYIHGILYLRDYQDFCFSVLVDKE